MTMRQRILSVLLTLIAVCGIAWATGFKTDQLTVTGNATVGGTLGVTGATTLGSTLGVTGTTTLGVTNTSSIAVSGAATVGATLNVVGNLTENSVRVLSAVGSGLSKSGGTVTLNMAGGTCTNGSISAINSTGTITCTTLTNVGLGILGDGADGDLNFDGVSTVTLAGPGGGSIAPATDTGTIRGFTYTYYALPRDIAPRNVTVANNVLLFTGGYRIFANGTITFGGSNAIIGAPGNDGPNGVLSGSAAAPAGRSQTILGASGTGGAGGNTSTGSCTNGGNLVNAVPGASTITSGACHGGAGGRNAAAAAGCASGSIVLAGAAGGILDSIFMGTQGLLYASQNRFTGGSGGGGGEGSIVGSGSQGSGGAGGTGGQPVVVTALTFSGPGKIVSWGGNGGTGFTGSGGGGGGGGGGGWATVVYGYGTAPTVEVTGGTGGAAGGAGSSLAGSNGGDCFKYVFTIGAF